MPQQILREHEQNGRIDAGRHRRHHIGGEYPENVIDEQASQEHATVLHKHASLLVDICIGIYLKAGQMQHFDAVERERQAQNVVGQPVPIYQVRNADVDEQRQRIKVMHIVLKIEQRLAVHFPLTIISASAIKDVLYKEPMIIQAHVNSRQ